MKADLTKLALSLPLANITPRKSTISTTDDILLVLGYSFMNSGIELYKERGNKAMLKKHSHLVKSLSGKIHLNYNKSDIISMLLRVEEFVREDEGERNITVDMFYCGAYIITSVNKDNVSHIYHSDISIISDYVARFLKEKKGTADVKNIYDFTSELLNAKLY
jgi:tRNA(His) 5'-end guanylyltransferase